LAFSFTGSLPEQLIRPPLGPEVKAILTNFRPKKSRPSGRILLACGAAKSVHGTVVDGHREESILENAVLMEIEKLRRVSLASLRAKYREVFAEETRCRHREHLFRRIAWRLQALAEGDLTERARERACQLARDADLRMVAPRDFFMVEGEPVRTTRGAGNRRPADDRLPLPGTLLSRKWKGRTLLVEVLADGNAQQKGWAVCPSKSLPAQAIEESVLGRIRQAQGGAADAAAWEQMGRERQRELIEGLVISARAPPARYP
jgi:hypothetical protein